MSCTEVAPHAGDFWLSVRKAISFSLGTAVTALSLTAQEPYRTWKDYGGGSDSSKYFEYDQINKSNVSQLQVAWTYPTRDNNSYAFNPIIVDNVMYVLARNSSLAALDATTGKEIWVHENLRGISSRGINYWESKDRKDRRLIFPLNHFLQQIDARTGKSILTFGRNGIVDLREGLGRDPKTVTRIKSDTPGRVFENLIIVGSSTGENYFAPPGDIRAYDVITGKLVWSFHTIPHPGEFGYETWPKDAWKYAGGTNTWGEMSLDKERGILYAPTGSSTYDIYGGDRIGSNLFANCLLALDARTGRRLWHFQMVHHDLWDYDPTSAPQLITARHEGKMVDAVAQATKQGFLFVFDRVTGEPLWPIEEHPVPKSDMPGEQAWPTQPFPTVPPPFARQQMTPDDINPHFLTPEERSQWKDRIASARTGLFAPPSSKYDTIALPGARGGSNWGSTAANPTDGTVYVITQDWPSVYKLDREQPAAGVRQSGASGGPEQAGQILYRQSCMACHGEDRAGSATAPPLAGLAERLTFDDFRQVVLAGKGQMPGFPSIDNAALNALFAHLENPEGAPPAAGLSQQALSARGQELTGPRTGPVVASGGAPGGQRLPDGQGRYGRFGGPPYPEGVEAPSERYYSSYGLDYPEMISPPWSSIVAYDLNTGTIKWKRPLGEDSQAMAEGGGRDTGVLRGGERCGMVVTSTGLVFVNARDGKLRVYDADNGNVLWTTTLPAGTQGIPAMYEVRGRQYLVVSAASTVLQGRQARGGFSAVAPGEDTSARGYVVFTLPEASKTLE